MNFLQFGNRRKKGADLAVRALGDALIYSQKGNQLSLYTEVTAATIDLILLENYPDGACTCAIPADALRYHIREAWNQFRLQDRPIWRGFEMTVQGADGQSSTFFYAPNFNEASTFKARARRWAISRHGQMGLMALSAQQGWKNSTNMPEAWL